jgi:hypothetical protein
MDRRARRIGTPAPGLPYDDPACKAQVNSMLRISAIGMLIAAPLSALAFVAPLAPSFALSFLSQLGLFAAVVPAGAAVMAAVPVERRASAVAINLFTIHVLGDLWSAAALGLLQDLLPVVVAMMSLPLCFAWNAYTWWPRAREAAANDLPTATIHA